VSDSFQFSLQGRGRRRPADDGCLPVHGRTVRPMTDTTGPKGRVRIDRARGPGRGRKEPAFSMLEDGPPYSGKQRAQFQAGGQPPPTSKKAAAWALGLAGTQPHPRIGYGWCAAGKLLQPCYWAAYGNSVNNGGRPTAKRGLESGGEARDPGGHGARASATVWGSFPTARNNSESVP